MHPPPNLTLPKAAVKIQPIPIHTGMPVPPPAPPPPPTSIAKPPPMKVLPANPPPPPTSNNIPQSYDPVQSNDIPQSYDPVQATSQYPSDPAGVLAPPPPDMSGPTQYLPDPQTGEQITVVHSDDPPPQAVLPAVAQFLPKETIWHKLRRWLHLAK